MQNGTDINANSVLLVLTQRKPGNRRKVNSAMIEVDADKDAVSVGKELLDSPEYQDIVSFEGEVRHWIYTRSLPAYGTLKDGVYRIPLALVNEVDAEMIRFNDHRQSLIEAFLASYPLSVELARSRLRSLFDPSDYPDVAQVRTAFDFQYRYLVLGVPKNLSAHLIAREFEKAAAAVASEIEEIKLALRTSFADLIQHAADRLQVRPDGKKVIFRDSMVKNMEDFLDYFTQRNIVNDGELAALVERARKAMQGVTPDDLRDNDGLRYQVQQTMTGIKKTMDDSLMLAARKLLI
jgi:hypothetical protein